MRVRLICYEDTGSWILGKFAMKLREELRLLSVNADIDRTPDPEADINHHIIYLDNKGQRNPLDTVMVTHIDADWKFRILKSQSEHVAAVICMSADTMKTLSSAGIPAAKLCFINPAHDGSIKPKPIRIGITTRVYPDGRKRERLLLQLAHRIDPEVFTFAIMGEGWEDLVAVLRGKGFSIDYRPVFDHEAYRTLIQDSDYYLYLGLDEGSMGFIDALAAGIPTIATPQGYHLDAAGGLTFPFKTAEELDNVFRHIADARQIRIDSVARWTWRDYAAKHRDLWNFLLTGARPAECLYKDGLASLGLGNQVKSHMGDRLAARLKFIGGSLRGIGASFQRHSNQGSDHS